MEDCGMEGTALTTTLSELNKLYGVYVEATEGDVRDAMRAWIAYEVYVRRYNRERGLETTPDRGLR